MYLLPHDVGMPSAPWFFELTNKPRELHFSHTHGIFNENPLIEQGCVCCLVTAHLASLSLGTARVRKGRREGCAQVFGPFRASYPLPFLLAYKGVGVKWNCFNVRCKQTVAELGDWEEAR